jgi:hypothetical protein
LLRKKLIGLPLVQKILCWRHTGFNVHSQVRAQTKSEAERVGKYMIRPLLSLKRLFFDEAAGRIRYRMRIISFIEEPKTIDRIIAHLKLTFEAERPASTSCSPAGVPDGSRGEWGVFLRAYVVVFCLFREKSLSFVDYSAIYVDLSILFAF